MLIYRTLLVYIIERNNMEITIKKHWSKNLIEFDNGLYLEKIKHPVKYKKYDKRITGEITIDDYLIKFKLSHKQIIEITKPNKKDNILIKCEYNFPIIDTHPDYNSEKNKNYHFLPIIIQSLIENIYTIND